MIRVVHRVPLADSVPLRNALVRMLDLEESRARDVVVLLLRRVDDLLLVPRGEVVGDRERGREIRLGVVSEGASVRFARTWGFAVNDLNAAARGKSI